MLGRRSRRKMGGGTMERSAASAVDANPSNGSKADTSNGTMEAALRRMATDDPQLAARMIVHSLPAAAATMPPDLRWRLSIDGLGDWTVRGSDDGGPASVDPSNGDSGEDFAIETD